ncbi:hypothetical protein OG439_42635 [Amycolatopsis sp. NBC_01307]|uniref:hypothetical protein n=1 Tax=Amycolatopsis sp. NBC_01307 TaxID=2903561 RepID=UPI002E168476|nr:hypothetical protein OG439_42635 [Amycolatopsis sp. NBC_01307]
MDVRPALWAVVAGAASTLAVFWFLQAVGPSGWEEAVVEAADPVQWPVSTEPGAGEDQQHHLVLRTASGEHFEVWGKDRHLGQSAGTWLRAEISDVGREVQAIEADGRRTTVDSGGLGVFLAALIGLGFLAGALGACADAKRPIPAMAGAVAGLGAGALPVFLLF